MTQPRLNFLLLSDPNQGELANCRKNLNVINSKQSVSQVLDVAAKLNFDSNIF